MYVSQDLTVQSLALTLMKHSGKLSTSSEVMPPLHVGLLPNRSLELFFFLIL